MYKFTIRRITLFLFCFIFATLQADVDISFKITGFEKAEKLDPSWTNPQLLCSQKGASVKGGLGPFGLLVFASKGLEEYTAVFFRIFKNYNKYVVLLCSDQSRFLCLSLNFIIYESQAINSDHFFCFSK